MAGNITPSMNGAWRSTRLADQVGKVTATPYEKESLVKSEAGTSYTLVEGDWEYFIRFTSGSRATLTLPTDASNDLPIGFWAAIYAEGVGGVAFSTSGITLTGNNVSTIISQNDTVTALKVAANTWTLTN